MSLLAITIGSMVATVLMYQLLDSLADLHLARIQARRR